MLGYLLGAYMTSITLGLVIVFALPGSSTESTSKHGIGPTEDIVIGLLLWVIAFALRTERDRAFQESGREKKDAKLRAREQAGRPTDSLPLRMLGQGDPKVTFVVGARLCVAWIGRSGRTAAEIGAGLIGVWLVARGAITLLWPVTP